MKLFDREDFEPEQVPQAIVATAAGFMFGILAVENVPEELWLVWILVVLWAGLTADDWLRHKEA